MIARKHHVSYSAALFLFVVAFAAGVVVGHLLRGGHVPADPVDAGK